MRQSADWALITGAGSGIGAALAQTLAARGVGVVLVGRRAHRLTTVAERIRATPTLCLPADIGCPAQRDGLANTLRETLEPHAGRLRHVVHAAATGDPFPDFARTDPGALSCAFAVNVVAPMALIQELMPLLKAAGDGRILLMGAGIADRAQPGTGVYGITKAALARLFDQMVADFAREVDAAAPAVALFQPGLTDTEGLRAHLAAARAAGLPHADWLADQLAGGRAHAVAAVAEAAAMALLDLPRAEFHGRRLRAATLIDEAPEAPQ